MQGITIKLPETTLRKLRTQARETGRSVAALVRDRVEAAPDRSPQSVFALSSDLAGSLSGRSIPASNARRKFPEKPNRRVPGAANGLKTHPRLQC